MPKVMHKLLKNLKISTTIFFMSILSVVFISVIGALGLINMRTINNNMTLMYKDNLQPIAQIGVIRGNFLNMRIESFSAMITYSGSAESNVTKYIGKTDESIKVYQSGHLDSNETQTFEQFTSYYKQYLDQWEQINSKLKKGQSADLTDRSTLNSIGTLAEQKLSQLRDYNEKQADQVNNSSSVLFSNTFKLALAIFIFCVVFFITASIFVIRTIKNSAKEMIQSMEVVADGDFTIQLDTNRTDEFGMMKKSLAKTIANVSDMLKNLKDKSQIIDSQSRNLSLISDEMSSSAENVASSVSQVASGAGSQAEEMIVITETLNEFSNKLENMVQAITDIDSYTKGVSSTANESNEKMETLIASVNKVSSSFKDFEGSIASLSSDINKINEITNFINSISEQTNLLALNAAIEAARAGEAGRGFSVVADEIRKLAEQSKTSSETINSLIRGVSGNSSSMVKTTEVMSFEVNNQVLIINAAIASFKTIISSVNSIIPQIDQINTLAYSINEDKSSIMQKVEASSSIAEEVSASSEEISAASEEMSSSSEEVAASALALNDMTKEMMEQVNKFKLS
jgi:methyl-accepting chemotaxis protein